MAGTEVVLNIQWKVDDCVGQDLITKKWYYYDESELLSFPFDTEHEARIDLAFYCFFCLDGHGLDGLTQKQRRALRK